MNTFEIKDGILTEYNGRETVAVIPSNVRIIGRRAFGGKSELREIVIPEGVVEIQMAAFDCCKTLTAVSLPKSLKIIGESAFNECECLEKINFPEGLEEIERNAFAHCHALSSVTLPESITHIGEGSFSDTAIESVYIPANASFVGRSAFSYSKRLTAITVDTANSHYKSINGILYNKEMTKLIFCPDGISGEVELPDGVAEIGRFAFHKCRGLTAIRLPESVKKIGMWTFSQCAGLTEFRIPDKTEIIEMSAFEHCTGLLSIVLPDSVRELGMGAFSGCRALKSVLISNKITELDTNTFCSCDSLESVNIPDGVKRIGTRAFSDCKSLKELILPKGIENIKFRAFAGCDSLKKIVNLSKLALFSDYTVFDIDGMDGVDTLFSNEPIENIGSRLSLTAVDTFFGGSFKYTFYTASQYKRYIKKNCESLLKGAAQSGKPVTVARLLKTEKFDAEAVHKALKLAADDVEIKAMLLQHLQDSASIGSDGLALDEFIEE